MLCISDEKSYNVNDVHYKKRRVEPDYFEQILSRSWSDQHE